MAVVALVAVVLWLLHYPDGVPFAIGLGSLALAFGCGLAVRARRRAAAIALVTSVVAANVGMFPVCLYLDGPLLIIAGLEMCVAIPAILGFGTAWAVAATRRDEARPGQRSLMAWNPLLAFLLVLALAASPPMAWVTFWPLRTVFFLSRPALESLADQVAAGQAPPFPTWAGSCRIVGYRIDPDTGNVALITDPNPAGHSAFVRYHIGPDSKRWSGPLGSPFMSLDLNPTWRFEMED